MSQLKPTLILLMSVGMFISSSLFAAVEPSALKIDGKKVDAFGPSACKKPGTNVEVELPPKVLQDHDEFYAMFIPVSKKTDAKAKAETTCPATVTDSVRLEEKFPKGAANIEVRKFMTDAACGKEGATGERELCIYVNRGNELVSYARFAYGTSFAKIEEITDVSGANGEVSFTVKYKAGTAGAESPQFVTCFGKTAEGNIDEAECPHNFLVKTSSKADVVISGLENDVQYGFKVRIVQGVEESPWFPSFKVKPERQASPLSAYQGKGGDIQFTCQQGHISSMWVFLCSLLGLWLLRLRHGRTSVIPARVILPSRKSNNPQRRARIPTSHHGPLVVLGLFFLLSLVLPNTGYTEPGQVNIGLLGAMYRPDLDSEVTAAGNKIFPFYKCFFRKKTSQQDGPINPLLGAEVDVHLWDRFGSLQLGMGLGYTFTRGHQLRYNAAGEPDCDNPNEASKISLHMYQVRPQLTYMFNPYADIVPLIPYVRAGLIGHGYMFFRGSKSEASSTTSEGTLVKPNGFRFGYNFALGLMLMLDFLEPSALRTSRGQGFLEHVYLKGELAYTKIDTFGRRGFQFSAKDVMGSSWPLMWTFGLVFELP